MQYRMMVAKIHRAKVTAADLHYTGSITIDQTLLEAAGLLPYEMVQITNTATGTLWQTYIIAGPAGGGDICLNGPPARHFQPGDDIIVLGYRWLDERELATYRPVVLFVDDNNRIRQVVRDEKPFQSGKHFTAG